MEQPKLVAIAPEIITFLSKPLFLRSLIKSLNINKDCLISQLTLDKLCCSLADITKSIFLEWLFKAFKPPFKFGTSTDGIKSSILLASLTTF